MLGEELRAARSSAGLSIRVTARAAGISASHLSRIERARVRNISIRNVALLFAVLGHRLSVKAYPDASPLREEAHARLLERLRRQLPRGATVRTEVPLGLPGDLRAWDAEIRLREALCKVEAETALRDLQAVDRRLALKMADDHVDHVLLVIADTRPNRRVLRSSAPCYGTASRSARGRSWPPCDRVAAREPAGSSCCDLL
ncbi:hypothetical protein BH24CHL9_BH24CHL9_05790 [soil metagenome]